MNLFEAAAANVPALEGQLSAVKLGLTSAEIDVLERFRDWILANGRVGINIRQTGLLMLLTTDSYQNIYEWAREQSAVSGRSVNDILKQRLGTFFQKRITFDGFFDRGSEFRYGALVVSGLGAINYGNYCVVLKSDWILGVQLAYLRSDSLRTYMVSDLVVDDIAIKTDVAPATQSHILAALKHWRAVSGIPEHAWPSMLCSDRDFIEAVFLGDVVATDIQEVRINKSDYDLYFYYAFDDFRGKLDEADRALIDSFNSILKVLARKSIPMEVI